MSLKGIFPIDKWDFDSQSILKDLLPDDYDALVRNASEEQYDKGVLQVFTTSRLVKLKSTK